jgi:membrane protease YdiL (CAAX protease family)
MNQKSEVEPIGESTRARWWQSLWDNLVAPLQRVEKDAQIYRMSTEGKGPDVKLVAVLIMTAVALLLQRYVDVKDFCRWGAQWVKWLNWPFAPGRDSEFWRLTDWAIICVTTYFVLPALLLRYGFRESLRDYGVKLGGALAGWPLYVAMFVIMVPLIFWMSRLPRFQETYPFYRLAPEQPLWPIFWCWEALYAMQFISLEFFFRGYLLHSLKHRFGAYAIPVMMVPYCMIHFTKPMPEACASIVAGLVLGYMSLRTRSIWLGAALHITVALSMDFASLWRQGRFG